MNRPEATTWKDLFAETSSVPDELLRWWLSDARGCSLTTLPLDTSPTASEREAFHHAVQRLSTGEPVQYVCGTTPFRHLTLHVSPAVLIPRPETEQLVQWALDLGIPHQARVLDVGTGSGCIALSLKQERPDLFVEGVDISAEALEVANQNARELELRVNFRQGDLLSAEPDASWDVVISNPPYIAETERLNLPQMVRDFEPPEALFSGLDGLHHIERLLREASRVLTPQGFVLMETGETQGNAIRTLAEEQGWTHQHRMDLAGRERFHLLRRA